METIIGGLAFAGIIAAHLFAVAAVRDTNYEDRPGGRLSARRRAFFALFGTSAPEAR
jgi:hypothetical protein